MPLLIFALAAAASTPQSSPATHCPRMTRYYALDRSQEVKPRRLAELPDANAYKAVYRTIGGCEAPVLVKYRVSGRN